MTRHTRKWREQQLDYISSLLNKYKVIGIGDLNNFPANLLHKLRKDLFNVEFKVTNKNILKFALEKTNNKDIENILPNQPILILSSDDAFNLYNKIKKNKARSKAKVGMTAPDDIVVPEGDTGLPPGPALSDLKKVGIKAQVKGSTIAITQDTTIAKAGDEITEDIVSTLSKLGIKPVELMLNVSGIKEDSVIYKTDVLDIDADEIYNDLVKGLQESIALGVEISYPTELTIKPMISKAEIQAKALEEKTSESESQESKKDSENKDDKESEEKDSKNSESSDSNKENKEENKQ